MVRIQRIGTKKTAKQINHFEQMTVVNKRFCHLFFSLGFFSTVLQYFVYFSQNDTFFTQY